MKNLDKRISDKVIQLRNQYQPNNIPELKRPDDDAIREYVKYHKDSLSLTDFADWIIKNIKK